jgi:hypothetical protein
MEENKIQETADSLREKAAARKKTEKEDQTKSRLSRAVSKRDAAMKRIYEYQDKTGTPTDEETSTEFLNNIK